MIVFYSRLVAPARALERKEWQCNARAIPFALEAFGTWGRNVAVGPDWTSESIAARPADSCFHADGSCTR